MDSPHSTPLPQYSGNHAEEILNLQLELDIVKTILGEERSAGFELQKRAHEAENELTVANGRILQREGIETELKEARSVIKALESQHILSMKELEELRNSNKHFSELLRKQEKKNAMLKKQISDVEGEEKLPSTSRMPKNQASLCENGDSPLQEKLKSMQASLEKARQLNTRFQNDQASQTSVEQEKDEVRRQVEAETTEVIVCLQEELITLQQHVNDSNRNEVLARQSLLNLETELRSFRERLSVVTLKNERLEKILEDKEQNLRILSEDWERLAYEIAEVLADGNVSLENASAQVASISDSFPSSWVTEQVGKIIRNISEKDLLIEELQKCLEEAQNIKCDMEWKLSSLRGATMAMAEAQQQENSHKEREIVHLTSELSQKLSVITKLEDKIKLGEERLKQAEICATVAFTIVNRFSEINATQLQALEHVKLQLNESAESLKQKDALLQDQMLFQVNVEYQMQTVRSQVEQFQEQTQRLLKLEQSLITVENQVEVHRAKGYNLSEEEMKPSVGENLLHSCMNEYPRQVSCPAEGFIEGAGNVSEHPVS